MKRIVIAHQKGGVGKSTIVINLAICLQKKVFFTSIIDIDNQGTSTKCSTLCIRENEITNQDFVIYDTPAYRTNKYKELFMSADIIN
jgi:chromosome partitioning protein